MKKNKILIVDDELSVRTSLEKWFLEDGFCVETAASGEEGLNKMNAGPYDILLLDIKMPGMDGITLQKKIKEIDDRAVVIIMTAYAAVDTAVEALKLGAFDYITKPFEPEALSRLVFNALKQKELADENLQLKEQMSELMEVDQIIGVSDGIKRIKEMVNSVAKTDSSVLIRGESGTEKELVARAIPKSLLESELYGHEKGTIKHAQSRRKGKIELANGGILVIADIDAFTLQMQGDLLKVIESKKFMRLGGSEEIPVDLRLICMTKKDLENLVKKEEFREDLYYRICVCSIFMPLLRERREDIMPLARHFITKLARKFGIQEKRIHPEAEKCILEYSWPGNVRELENDLSRSLPTPFSHLIMETGLKIFYSADRNQYHSTSILSQVITQLPKDGEKIVGITDVDIYIPILTFKLI